jgi:hypothetical protein
MSWPVSQAAHAPQVAGSEDICMVTHKHTLRRAKVNPPTTKESLLQNDCLAQWWFYCAFTCTHHRHQWNSLMIKAEVLFYLLSPSLPFPHSLWCSPNRFTSVYFPSPADKRTSQLWLISYLEFNPILYFYIKCIASDRNPPQWCMTHNIL